MRAAFLLLGAIALSACVKPAETPLEAPPPAPEAVKVSDESYVPPDLAEGGIVFRTGAARAAADEGIPASEEPAVIQPGAPVPLGEITVSLGPPAETGLWASSGLLDTVQPVLLEDPAAGVRIKVEMRPTDGVDQLSLEAYQALGLSPAEIVTLTVHPR